MPSNKSDLSTDFVIKRIIYLAKRDGRHERDVIDYLGLKRGTFANWKRGQSDSYLHYLKEIAEFFHVTPNYLILGDDGIEIKKGEDIFTKEELELIDSYRNLNIREKRYIKEMVNIMQES